MRGHAESLCVIPTSRTRTWTASRPSRWSMTAWWFTAHHLRHAEATLWCCSLATVLRTSLALWEAGMRLGPVRTG